jgi:hypothetical protein
MAADPDVKAIVLAQGYPGTAAAIDKVHEMRPEVFFINVVPHEEPLLAASKSGLVFETDNLARGTTIIELAKKMGAKTFVHYSFPRHMSYPLLAQRRDIFEEQCKKQGLEFVFVNAPDPTGDAGVAGAQQFILEDVPRQVEKYGKDTAFFSTNCGMQEPLIKSVLNTGAIYPEQCCPSPYHAYPGALGIAIPEGKAGDVPYIIEAINQKLVEQGGAGRFATWSMPPSSTASASATAPSPASTRPRPRNSSASTPEARSAFPSTTRKRPPTSSSSSATRSFSGKNNPAIPRGPGRHSRPPSLLL